MLLLRAGGAAALRRVAGAARRAAAAAPTTCAAAAQRSSMASASDTAAVAEALRDVNARIAAAVQRSGRNTQPRLVAVSKTKPAAAVMAAYDAGQRAFGENYVQELIDKAPLLPADVSWHFIGHLQGNKVRALLEGVPTLAMVETVDAPKLADRLDRIAGELGRAAPLAVMLQVNTSGEPSKHGVEPDGVVALARHVAAKCPRLRVAGLMTIGMPDYTSRPENFACLAECRDAVAAELGVDPNTLELSMGMSGDFEAAIEMGATNVRVGSTIFGARDYGAAA